jgi:carbon storage regulator
MLILSRKKNESIVIDGDITVTVLEIRGDTVRLGIVCPKEIPVYREELCDAAAGHASFSGASGTWPGASVRRKGGEIEFIEISLGQLMAEVGAHQSNTAPDGGFTNEGGISPLL